VWQQNWLFVRSGLIAKVAAHSKYIKVWQQNWLLVRRYKGMMAELAPREISEIALPYLAWGWRQLFLGRLCHHI
jgi:hypothetical protein